MAALLRTADQWGITPGAALAGLAFALLAMAISLGAALIVVIRMPATYFVDDRAPKPSMHPAHRVARRVGKNALGVALLGAGVVLALPGVPGPGVATMLLGAMLIDFPGKRRFEQRVLASPKVLGSVNRIRRRFGREPIIVHRDRGTTDPPPGDPALPRG